jgi:hypothetical protein
LKDIKKIKMESSCYSFSLHTIVVIRERGLLTWHGNINNINVIKLYIDKVKKNMFVLEKQHRRLKSQYHSLVHQKTSEVNKKD